MRTPQKRLSDAIDIVVGGRDPDARRALVGDLPHAPQLAEVAAALEEALAPMAEAGDDVQPPADLFARIEATLDAEAALDRYARNVRLDAPGWDEIVPGVLIRRLWDTYTFLARLEPGRAFPPHDHPWTEHCLVLRGDMVVDGVVFGPGDYHAPAKGSRHGDLRTEHGLLLLVQRQD
jgi:anti-sigma factor ChrR (cupin superfamily)